MTAPAAPGWSTVPMKAQSLACARMVPGLVTFGSCVAMPTTQVLEDSIPSPAPPPRFPTSVPSKSNFLQLSGPGSHCFAFSLET